MHKTPTGLRGHRSHGACPAKRVEHDVAFVAVKLDEAAGEFLGERRRVSFALRSTLLGFLLGGYKLLRNG